MSIKGPDEEIAIGTHITNFPTQEQALKYANAWSALHRQKTKVLRMHRENFGNPGTKMYVVVCDSLKIPVICTYKLGECPRKCINYLSEFTSTELCVLTERK